MTKKALIVQGGWDGHEPVQVSELFRDILTEEGFAVRVEDTLDAFLDEEELLSLHLIVPVWTMGKITQAQLNPVLKAVAGGVGIAGCHGGMCDAFRECVDWQFMTGGNWVAHPGNDGTEYVVNIKRGSSPIVEGIEDFTVKSEQYYLHVDPAVEVLATTRFPPQMAPRNQRAVDMVVWTKRWAGRVFIVPWTSCDIVAMKPVKTIMRWGLWAAEAGFGRQRGGARGWNR